MSESVTMPDSSSTPLSHCAVHQNRLKRLVDPDALLPIIKKTSTACNWWSDFTQQHWQRSYSRIDYGKQPWCTLLYETSGTTQEQPPRQALCLIELFDKFKSTTAPHESLFFDPALGWLRLTRFPYDLRLPTLAKVLESNPKASVVRYRPGRRCTLRQDNHATKPAQFIKVFPDQRGQIVHQEGVQLWQAVERGELAFSVAQPGLWQADELTLWQSVVAGKPVLDTLYSKRGCVLAEQMGQAAASLSQSNLQPQAVFDQTAQQQRSARYLKQLRLALPDQISLIDQLKQSLENLQYVSEAPYKPIHGSLHAHQWLLHEGRLGLVDFDRISIGEPELDVATFVAELDYAQPKGVARSDLIDAFIHGYETINGPLKCRSLQFYRAHKHLSKALKAARSIRTDNLQRATRNLHRALDHCEAGQ